MPTCNCKSLIFTPSDHAKDAGYKRATPLQLLAAAEPSGKAPKIGYRQSHAPSTFPAPLVLPGDELFWDPDYETQSLKSWIDEPYRNAVTPARRTLYVVAAPSISDPVSFMNAWVKPPKTQQIPPPQTSDVVDYLQAFYTGLSVRLLARPKLSFMKWEYQKSKSDPPRIGLNIGSELIGIRYRPTKDNAFPGQLNLSDLLDAALRMLPKDAYAMIMLFEHDLYEDDEDDFCCGRAYGGSRVSVVSMARYHPGLDEVQSVEREHAWPAAHCREYVEGQCREEGVEAPKGSRKKAVEVPSVLGEAVDVWKSLPPPSTYSQLRNLWLGRLCKTASHELGHCMGMDHCVYYACIMQGTATIIEDARQPPYLCPVDSAKVLTATEADEATWSRNMLKYCERFSDDRMFMSLAAWLKGRLLELENVVS